ncbi:uncharacterized protein SPSK_04929 [Sporothrix schenckii 1099-18]|uniref:Uncharacterized protein n=1 Tax=Sporothrix schenckii 1099-18 TaxID=1397361 RepID=A0A0F2LUX8_SPOSC|nr:uncharacterized protein SPSK_04929 [Sporothrix schenckii 1099-18]KJR80310.1 hypothetical protein SPSK_04929 [Sporothrix schenckii 1099-18]
MSTLFYALAGLAQASAVFGTGHTLTGRTLRMTWTDEASSDGSWTASVATLSGSSTWTTQSSVLGQYSVLTNYTTAAQSTSLVQAGALGTLHQFGADSVDLSADGATLTTTTTVATDGGNGTYTAVWAVDTTRSWDLLVVNATWTAPAAGWVSLASPRLVELADSDLDWGVVPGYWSANSIETSKELFYKYVQGVPASNWVSVEASTTSLVAILGSAASGTTFAAIAHPSLARDPFANNSTATQQQWNVGMSLRGPTGTLSPTAYYPVLGQAHSQLAKGASVTGRFLYSVTAGHATTQWYEVNRFVSQEVYPLDLYDAKAVDTDALSDRLHRIHDFVTSAASKWHRWTFDGLEMGAESGKLSDVASMWMVQRLTGDPLILHERLPYARNFKLGQQDTSGGVFDGAALGEYYLNGAFVCELLWTSLSTVDYVSPMFTTFYILSDVGNILLFNRTDALLLERFTTAADKLLAWQKSAGDFDVGYRKASPATLMYPELQDLRATWYGLLAAYRVLGDAKYLAGAEAGAQWLIAHAVRTGRWLGVCDDTYLYPDFQTGHAAGALLQLYDATNNSAYLDAAVQTAKFYTLHIFNHPQVDASEKNWAGAVLADWQVSQVGLNYEHAGYGGSVASHGPITISSHAGLFVKIYAATGDAHFLQLARIAARGRDAFVTPVSGIPSYYWYQGNTGGSSYPWHGWWHIGWLTDYLVSSAQLLSGGQISFPEGFLTSKVGSHVPYGFATGTVYGTAANLWQPRSLVAVTGSTNVDWLTALSADGATLFVILLNQVAADVSVSLSLDPRQLQPFAVAHFGAHKVLAATGAGAGAGSTKAKATPSGPAAWSVDVAAQGMTVLALATTYTSDPLGPAFRTYNVSGAATAPTVAWSYWTAVESWAEWAVPGSGVWTPLPASTNYTFAATLDLANVTVPQIKIRIKTQSGTKTGISNATYWTVN